MTTLEQRTTAIIAALAVAGVAQAQVIDLRITLDGDQESPPVMTAANGQGTATLDLATNEFSWDVTFQGLSSPQTAAHFHGAAPQCSNAGVQLGLSVGSPLVGSATVTAQQAADILAGLWYLNIHSQNHGSGEIRGQVMPAALADPIPGPIAAGDVHVALAPVSSGLVAPNWGEALPGQPGRMLVVDQPGTLWAVDLATGDRTAFLDASGLLVDLGVAGPGSFDERGLLGVAMHPDYLSNGRLYTYTSEPLDGPADFSTMPAGIDANHQSVIREWTVPNPNDPASVVDPGTTRVLMRVDQPQFNHDGGAITFGPDGMLYISFGDGGGADDKDGQISGGVPMVGHGCIGNGADATTILGSVARIDPDGTNSANGAYGIPADNPFVEAGDTRLDEIFAYGLRNPFRMSFDSATGDFYVADVGQREIEEINLVESGGNYGWNDKEGSFYFVANGNLNGYVTDLPLTVAQGLIDPIAEYDHDEGISIIGGFVYRGTRIPALTGRYVFGDWNLSFFGNDGRLFYLDEQNEIREFPLVGQDGLGLSLQGFGQDAFGEIYVLGNLTGTPFDTTGVVLKIGTALGDTDANGVVDFTDLLTVLGSFGPYFPCPATIPADIDENCEVDFSDVLAVLSNWG